MVFLRARYVVPAVVLVGCQLHDSNNDGGAINLAVSGDAVFVARGCDGIEVADATTGVVLTRVEPLGDSDSYDDLSSADGLLFALDADDGYLTTFSIGADRTLQPLARDESVEVGPYSGVAAASSIAAVSGGTSEISFYSYAGDGSLARTGTLAGHRGHPDIAIEPAARYALVSTHYDEPVDGHEFGIVSVALGDLAFRDSIGIPGAGFTGGGATPASFPLRVAFFGDHALVAHGGGLSVLHVNADFGLELVTTLDLELDAVDVDVEDSGAYVVGSSPRPRLVEIDLSDVTAPAIGRTFDLAGDDAIPTAVAVVGAKVFIAASDAGLKVIDR